MRKRGVYLWYSNYSKRTNVELLPEILKVGILIEGIKEIQNGLEAKFVLILKGKNKIRNF